MSRPHLIRIDGLGPGASWWMDPCGECGADVTGVEARAITVTDNPDSLIVIPDPACPHEGDPAADCTCTVIPNPAPDPLQDEVHVVGYEYTLFPCGHHPARIQVYPASASGPASGS
jgi:hypothetical protein